jgi:hypothetical protein
LARVLWWLGVDRGKTGKGKNEQRQKRNTGFFAALRMTAWNEPRQERTTAKAKYGVLRCAQNDSVERTTARTGNGKSRMEESYIPTHVAMKPRHGWAPDPFGLDDYLRDPFGLDDYPRDHLGWMTA